MNDQPKYGKELACSENRVLALRRREEPQDLSQMLVSKTSGRDRLGLRTSSSSVRGSSAYLPRSHARTSRVLIDGFSCSVGAGSGATRSASEDVKRAYSSSFRAETWSVRGRMSLKGVVSVVDDDEENLAEDAAPRRKSCSCSEVISYDVSLICPKTRGCRD